MRKIFPITILIILYLVLFFWRFKSISDTSFDINNEYISGVIMDEPVVSGNRQVFMVDGIQAITKRYPEYHYGDQIKLKVVNKKSSNKILYYPQIKLIDKSQGNPILEQIYRFREKAVLIFEKTLPQKEAGLLAGIVLGLKNSLPSSFNQALKNTGTMHIVVASGMNITFVTGYLITIFTFFFGRRKAIVLSFIGIFLYTALAGFQAPIIRAGIMGGFVLLASLLGKQSYGILSFIITILIMLLWNPLYLGDVGFQLSAGATLGLLIIRPLILRYSLIKMIDKNKVFGESLITTISAQMAVSPILFFYFGQISLISPLVNMLILWEIPVLMILGAIILILGFIYLPLAQISSYFAYGFLFLFTKLIEFFGKGEWGLFLSSEPSLLIILGYYLILISLLLNKKTKLWEKRKTLVSKQ